MNTHRLALVLLTVVSCRAPEDLTRQLSVPAPGPFLEASVLKGRVYVRLNPKTPLETAVALSPKPLRGGMQLGEAASLAGEPVATRTDAIGTYYSFARPTELELAHLVYRDSGPVDKWVVVSARQENLRSSVFSPELLALLAGAGSINSITIHEHQRPHLQAFTAVVQGDRLLDMQWYSIEGIPGG